MKKLLSILILIMPIASILVGQGKLKAEYYNGTNFEEYVGTNYVSNIDFYWDKRAPINGLDPNHCSVIYTGQIATPKSGDITFSARVDDGIKVWIDDKLIISNWQLNDVGFSEGKIYMEKNEKYNIKVEYFNAVHEAEITLLWKLPEDEDKSWFSWWDKNDHDVVSADYFFPPIEENIFAALEAEPKPKPKPEPAPKSKPKPKPKPKPVPVPAAKPEPVLDADNADLSKNESVVIAQETATAETIEKYIPKRVEFETAKSEILAVSYPDLKKLANFLIDNPKLRLRILGHTDLIGNSKGNLILSEERAKVVAAYLIKNGVKRSQIISAVGYGDTRPLVHSDGKKHHPENRRVEFIIE